MNNIAETLRKDEEMKTLWEAIEKAELKEVLEEKGPYTIFAPTNSAFSKVPSDDLNELLGNKDELARTLKYHIVPGKYTSKDVTGMKRAKTVNGDEVEIDTSRGVRINDSKIIKSDVEGTNGIIHFIDTPLTPRHK